MGQNLFLPKEERSPPLASPSLLRHCGRKTGTNQRTKRKADNHNFILTNYARPGNRCTTKQMFRTSWTKPLLRLTGWLRKYRLIRACAVSALPACNCMRRSVHYLHATACAVSALPACNCMHFYTTCSYYACNFLQSSWSWDLGSATWAQQFICGQSCD